ncbi:MAG: DNA gyrase subunit A [Actinomycetota bacterium]
MTDIPLEPRIDVIDIEEEVKRSYLDYAMSVIVGRALPDVRDGLKPVHRRILHSMNDTGARPGTPFKKSARVVGDAMGRFHPHGDTAIYDALARMAQDFAMRAPLIQGHGNFGSVDGDPPAAMRYCVTGDTLVRCVDGTHRIRDLAPDCEPNSDAQIDVKVLDRNGNPTRASLFFNSGKHPLLRMTTREGFRLVGTENHPVLCLESVAGVPMLLWKLLSEVGAGDRVAMLRRLPIEEGMLSEQDWHLALLAGAMVSEGFVSENRAGFNNIDRDFFDQVLTAYDVVVGGPRYTYSRVIKSGSLLLELDVQDLTELKKTPLAEMTGLRSADKKIPSFVWQANLAFKATFLRALYEGVGCSSLLPRATISITYSTRSEQLARDVQQLLLEFGIVSRISRSPNGEIRVYISNRRDAWLFATRVGFLEHKQQRLLDQIVHIPGSSHAMSSDHFPFIADFVRSEVSGRWADREWLNKHNIDRIERWERDGSEIWSHITNDEVRRVIAPIVESGYFFAEVAEVTSAGHEEVYSLRVDSDDHSFITNGFVSHNTECRLANLAMELLRDIDEDTVDFVPNYDGLEQEPIVLPARFPNLLVNGSTGIAVGMATNIPPHNLTEVINATIEMIDNPQVSLSDLMKHIKGPDFPTGGIIMGRQGIKDAFSTGRGSVKVRGKATIEESKQGRQRIIVTELPYMVSGDRVLAKIAELVEKKVITGIATTRDALKNESNRHGLRLVIELKRDAIPQVVLNNLYKHTQLQDSFGVNCLALIDGLLPRTLPLADVLSAYIAHQVDVVTRRTQFRLRKAEERAHILEGLIVAFDNLDAVIALIRAADSAEVAREQLIARFGLTEIQATAILDMQLRRLAALERQKIIDEHTELMQKIADYKDILSKPERVRSIIKEEMIEIRDKFGDKRRTAIQADEGEIDVEDLIADEDVVITITRSGYIKRVNANVYRTQGRGGKGVRGAKPKEGDIVEHLLSTNAHAYVLFFSNRGKVYRIKAHEIPEKDRTARGISIRNLLPLAGDDSIAAVIDTADYETHKFLVIATKKGVIKKTAFSAYDSSRRDGIIAVKLRPGDEVVQVKATSGEDELFIATRKGQSIVFPETEVRPMGRDASGVHGLKVKEEDEVMAFDVVDPNAEMLIVTDAGYGKRTLLTQYPRQHRGGSGVRTVHLTARKGFVAGAMVVRPGHEVFLISSHGQVIRIPCKDVRRTGRDAQGVRVMRLDAEEKVVAMAPVIADEEGDE